MENNIDTLRKARGLTVQELADKAGISRIYLTDLKAGRKRLNMDVILRIAEALNCSFADIFPEEAAGMRKKHALKIDRALLMDCLHMLRKEAQRGDMTITNNTLLDKAISLYELAMEDREAGNDAISTGAMRMILAQKPDENNS